MRTKEVEMSKKCLKLAMIKVYKWTKIVTVLTAYETAEDGIDFIL